jgi:N-acetyl-gamma-glutamyl-phosphate reductase
MIRVGILGATGYTALELIKILLRHPGAQITAVTSRQEGRPPIASTHPSLTGRLDLPLEDFAPAAVAERCDCIFQLLAPRRLGRIGEGPARPGQARHRLQRRLSLE